MIKQTRVKFYTKDNKPVYFKATKSVSAKSKGVKKKIKGWALCFGNSMFAPRGTNGRKRFKAYLQKKYALDKAKQYENALIVPCTIEYSLPRRG